MKNYFHQIKALLLVALMAAGFSFVKADDNIYWFIVNVKPEYSGYNVWFLPVDLQNPETSEVLFSENVNQDYNAEFQNLPAGKYLLHINGTSNGLIDYYKEVEITDNETQHLTVTLGEQIITPYGLTADSEVNENGKYNVKLSWNNNDNPHLPYEYFIQVNGAGAYETSGCNYEFEDLDPGKYVFTIKGYTPSMNFTEEGSLEVELLPIDNNGTGSTSIQSINSDSSDSVYFDLQGRRLNSKPAAPGIYIRSNGSTNQKIIL